MNESIQGHETNSFASLLETTPLHAQSRRHLFFCVRPQHVPSHGPTSYWAQQPRLWMRVSERQKGELGKKIITRSMSGGHKWIRKEGERRQMLLPMFSPFPRHPSTCNPKSYPTRQILSTLTPLTSHSVFPSSVAPDLPSDGTLILTLRSKLFFTHSFFMFWLSMSFTSRYRRHHTNYDSARVANVILTPSSPHSTQFPSFSSVLTGA